MGTRMTSLGFAHTHAARSRSVALGRARSRSVALGRARSRSVALGRARSRSVALGRARSRPSRGSALLSLVRTRIVRSPLPCLS